jgi:hypothetical protein
MEIVILRHDRPPWFCWCGSPPIRPQHPMVPARPAEFRRSARQWHCHRGHGATKAPKTMCRQWVMATQCHSFILPYAPSPSASPKARAALPQPPTAKWISTRPKPSDQHGKFEKNGRFSASRRLSHDKHGVMRGTSGVEFAEIACRSAGCSAPQTCRSGAAIRAEFRRHTACAPPPSPA